MRGQQSFYSGHERCHAFKYQSVAGPDGLLLHFLSPLEGRRHDMAPRRRSGMDQLLEQFLLIHGQRHYSYGDLAHAFRPWLQKVFLGAALDAREASFSREMSRSRESVERGFKGVKQLFSSNVCARQMRALKSRIGTMTADSSALANIRCCLYQPQASRCLDCPAPSLNEYLSFEAEGEQEEDLL